MRRFALAILIALLTLTASGVSSVLVQEPCTTYELSGSDDGTCPPSCVTCGCCAQAAVPAVRVATSSPDSSSLDLVSPRPGLPKSDSRDVMHVPRLHAA